MSPPPDRSPRPRDLVPTMRRGAGREAALAELRRRLRLAEAPGIGGGPVLPLGVPAIDRALPGGGLALDALHEVAPAGPLDHAAALGFLVACLRAAVSESGRPCLVARCGRGIAGRLDGHGLAAAGLPPDRLVLAETGDDAATLWAVEEAARSRALGAVAGCLEGGLDLNPSRRLQLAATGTGTLVLLLRAGPARPNAAATRWRVGPAAASRDRFGCLAAPRWRVLLERCRGAEPGAWEVEFDHGARGVRLAEALPHDAAPGERGRRGARS